MLDGQPVALAVTGSALTFPEGVGGLETLRLECALTAPLPAPRQAGRSLTSADANHQGRVGWREISAVGDRTTLASTDVPTTSTSARLTAYPPKTSSALPSTSAPSPSGSTPAAPRPQTTPGPRWPTGRRARTPPPGARPPGGGA